MPQECIILSGKDDLEVEFERFFKGKYIAIAHTNNINRQYENAHETVSDTESDQLKLQSRINDLTSDLVVCP